MANEAQRDAEADRTAAQMVAELGKVGRAVELRDPDAHLPALDRAVNKIAEVVGVIIIAVIFLIVTINALGRYIGTATLPWGEEVVISIIPWLCVSGLFLSVRRRELIGVSFFFDKFPPAVRQLVALGSQLLCCLLFGGLTYFALLHVQMFGGDITPVLEMPKGLTYSAMLIGGGAVALAFLVNAIRIIRARRA